MKRRTAEILDSPLPSNLEAERCVVGCVLLKPDLLAGMNLEAIDFHSQEHKKLWRVFSELAQQGIGIDHVTVMDRIRAGESDRDTIDNHILTIAEAAQSVAVWAHWGHYRDIVMRTCAKRAAVHFSVELLKGAYDDEVSPNQWVKTLLIRGQRMQEWLKQKRKGRTQ